MTDSTHGSTPNGEDGISDADRQWLEGLAGRAPRPGESVASRDVALLRKYFLQQQALDEAADQAQAVANPSTEDRKRQQQLFAARRAGVSFTPNPGILGWIQRDRAVAAWRWQQLGGVAAVVVLSVMVGLSVLRTERPKYGEPGTLMGESDVQHIKDHAPQARAEALSARLKAVGINTRLYQRKEDFFVDIEVLPERFEEDRGALVAAGVSPKPGLIRVQIGKP